MSVKAPVPRAYWVLSVLLCLCTLVALWITAWKIRQDKVAARRGGRQDEPSETDRLRRLPLARGKSVRAGHFKLGYPRDGALQVLDLNARTLVTFTDIAPGERRGWQELRLTCVAADPQAYLIEAEFRPGSACLGPGEYADLKAGLQIELDEGRLLTVVRWDAEKPEIYLAGPSGEAGLADGGEFRIPPYRARLAGRVLRVSRD
ncbi:MAG TPA: hypothetical protein VF950_22410 [Planctomycetota bacterium]